MPVFYAGVLGLVLAIVIVPKRCRWPLATLVIGMGTFVLVGLAGLSVIDRYLLVPSLMVMVFAAVTLGGWSMLRAGRLRTAWAVAAGLIVVYGVVFTATRVQFNVFDNELLFRGQSHAALEALFRNPKVRAGLKCGPVSVPNHKLVPDTRWVLKAGVDGVIARSDPASKPKLARGVAVYATNRQSLLRQGFTPDESSTEDIRNRCRCRATRSWPRPASTGRMSAVKTAPAPAPAPREAPAAGDRQPPLAVVDRAGRGPRGRARPAPVGHPPGPAVRVQRRRERPLRAGRDRPVRARDEPALLRQPAGLTYLLHAVFAVWFGGRAGVSNTYALHPTEVFVVARATAAVVGTVGVGLVYLAGAKLADRRVGLLAAALMAVAFLPVFYSHLALNDVPTLAPIALSLWGTAGVLRDGRVRWYALAGVGLGLSCATKYTGGIVLLPLLAAAGVQLVAGEGRRASRSAASCSRACWRSARSSSPTRSRSSTSPPSATA